MKIKRQKLFELLNGFSAVANLPGVKFAYAIVKNKQKITAEVKALNDSAQPTAEYQKWEKERMTICNEYCAKKDGKPVIENRKFTGLKDNKKFEKAIDKLKAKYKETLDDYEKKVKEYNKMIVEEIEIDLHKISKRDIPINITPKQLEAIELIVDDK